jgi:VIT1/CCC1 family predicted Fe2+/Mn2+ transporter
MHREGHNLGRRGWIRAGVLGANDGVVSIAALVMALVAGQVSSSTLTLSTLSALIAGAGSMAIGEYVSVASQKDIEVTNIAKEKQELKEDPEDELAELAGIYRNRGLSDELAMKVAVELSEHDVLQAHLRDELGIVEEDRARPFQAAYVSFIAFSLGGLLPYLSGAAAYSFLEDQRFSQLSLIAVITTIALAILGYSAAHLGGAPAKNAVIRVVLGGIAALVVTSILGAALA